MLVVLGLFVVSMMSAVSADVETFTFEDGLTCVVDEDISNDISCEYEAPKALKSFSASSSEYNPYQYVKTYIIGRLLDEDAIHGVMGANVEVICDNDGVLTVNNTISSFAGFFYATFDDDDDDDDDLKLNITHSHQTSAFYIPTNTTNQTNEGNDGNEGENETNQGLEGDDVPKAKKGFFSSITGAVTDTGGVVVNTLGKTGTAISGFFILCLLGAFGFTTYKKRKIVN